MSADAEQPAPETGERARRERLFFALWPDQACREALAGLARSRLPRKRGRLVPAENLHLTLAFLGAVDAEFRRCAEQAAGSLRLPGFALRFEQSGYWPRPRVLWTAPLETPELPARLASALSRALLACGYEPERRAFRAHVTLARKVQGPVETRPHEPVTWPVRDFHLVCSETAREGARYRILRSWRLA